MIFLTPTAAATAKIPETNKLRDLIGDEGKCMRNIITLCKKQRKDMLLFSMYY
jgi:hypothetical protein